MDNITEDKTGKIECVLRKYNIHMPGGSVLEVESTKPISEEETKRLLEEDDGMSNFFTHYKITGYIHPIAASRKILQENELRKKRQENESRKIRQGDKPRSDDAKLLTPLQRINLILEMKGEFTRSDYIEYMKGLGYDTSKWMAHMDFNNAIELKRLELVDHTRRSLMYKVIDPTPVDESLFKQLLKDRGS